MVKGYRFEPSLVLQARLGQQFLRPWKRHKRRGPQNWTAIIGRRDSETKPQKWKIISANALLKKVPKKSPRAELSPSSEPWTRKEQIGFIKYSRIAKRFKDENKSKRRHHFGIRNAYSNNLRDRRKSEVGLFLLLEELRRQLSWLTASSSDSQRFLRAFNAIWTQHSILKYSL